MERHCANALKVAQWLKANENVAWVNYPGLEGNKYYNLAQKYMPDGTSGVISFRIKGGRDAATKFMDSLQIAEIATHVADARTCVLHPASSTHRQLSDQELVECGVSPDLVRFSVGIENCEDITLIFRNVTSEIVSEIMKDQNAILIICIFVRGFRSCDRRCSRSRCRLL